MHRLSWWDTADAGRVTALLGFLAEQQPHLHAGLETAATPTHKRAWRLLLHYQRLVAALWTALRERLAGREEEAIAELRRAEGFLRKTEAETADALDTFLMLQYISRLMQ